MKMTTSKFVFKLCLSLVCHFVSPGLSFQPEFVRSFLTRPWMLSNQSLNDPITGKNHPYLQFSTAAGYFWATPVDFFKIWFQQDASSRCVTVLSLCPTPIWRVHIISKENSCFYLLSCLDIEICPPKSAMGTSRNLGR